MKEGPARYRYGPSIEEEGTRFRLWAPDRDLLLDIEGRSAVPMASTGEGWREAVAQAPPLDRGQRDGRRGARRRRMGPIHRGGLLRGSGR